MFSNIELTKLKPYFSIIKILAKKMNKWDLPTTAKYGFTKSLVLPEQLTCKNKNGFLIPSSFVFKSVSNDILIPRETPKTFWDQKTVPTA